MDDQNNRYDERGRRREFAGRDYAEQQQLARSFEDPNALDDARLGKSFEETNSSRKRKKVPARNQPPTDRRKIAIFLIAFLVLFLIVVIAGWLPRHKREQEIDQRARLRKPKSTISERSFSFQKVIDFPS